MSDQHRECALEIARLTEALDAYRAQLSDARAELAAAREDAERYHWLANRVLAGDYGDNPAKEVGWRVRSDLRNGEHFMLGESIDAAIDSARGEG